MSKTLAELKTLVAGENGLTDWTDGSYAPVVARGRLMIQYKFDTGEVDEQGNPITKSFERKVSVTQESLTALCSAVAMNLSGTTFDGEAVEAVFKSAFETSIFGE